VSGKHAAVPAVSAAASLTASVGLVPLALSGAAAAAPAHHAEVPVALDAKIVVRDMPAPRPLVTRIIHASARRAYTIASGDTLSGIAGRWCSSAARWPALFNGNKKVIGHDPDLILPGQKLTLTCHASMALPSMAPAQAVAQLAPTAATEAKRDPFDGKHGNCGDGDGDGMDASCAVIFPGHHQSGGSQDSDSESVRHAAPVQAAAAVTGVHGGTLSFAGLEALWEEAGGPSWAASAAAAVAECESGGNQFAHNPSGASGYWQILGQVVGGDIYNPLVNAENAIAKFRASGDTFAQWVCKP
jgi:hypothetical protein